MSPVAAAVDAVVGELAAVDDPGGAEGVDGAEAEVLELHAAKSKADSAVAASAPLLVLLVIVDRSEPRCKGSGIGKRNMEATSKAIVLAGKAGIVAGTAITLRRRDYLGVTPR